MRQTEFSVLISPSHKCTSVAHGPQCFAVLWEQLFGWQLEYDWAFNHMVLLLFLQEKHVFLDEQSEVPTSLISWSDRARPTGRVIFLDERRWGRAAPWEQGDPITGHKSSSAWLCHSVEHPHRSKSGLRRRGVVRVARVWGVSASSCCACWTSAFCESMQPLWCLRCADFSPCSLDTPALCCVSPKFFTICL